MLFLRLYNNGLISNSLKNAILIYGLNRLAEVAVLHGTRSRIQFTAFKNCTLLTKTTDHYPRHDETLPGHRIDRV